MTNPTDKLRAIVEVYERHRKRHGGLERSEQEASILAKTLLAVLERCEESRGGTDGFAAMAEEVEDIINTHMTEME